MPKLSKKASKKTKVARMSKEMDRWKHGEMHSGSKDGPVVKSHKQAVAIGLSQSGQSNRNTSKKQKKKVGKLKHSKMHYGHYAKGAKRKKVAYKR